MKIAFFLEHYSLRGTEVAVYDYAHYNETILQNKSIVISLNSNIIKSHKLDFNDEIYNKFKNRFELFEVNTFSEIEALLQQQHINLFYHLKSGEYDTNPLWGEITDTKTFIHCVFNTSYKHGDIYSPISECINKKYGTSYPVFPHIVTIGQSTESLKTQLNIPNNAIVFGRYGGYEFNTNFVNKAIVDVALENPNIYFIFMNTCPFSDNIKNIIYLPSSSCKEEKRKFINTCDALLHARPDGETFGLTIGEFSLCKKPTLSWYQGDLNHFEVLKDKIIPYYNYYDLKEKLLKFNPNDIDMENNGYMVYTPEYVMKIFNELINL